MEYISSPQTSSSKNNLSSCSTENSNLKLPSKYLNRRKGLQRNKTYEDLKMQSTSTHSNSQPTINSTGVYTITPEENNFPYSINVVDHSNFVGEIINNKISDKSKAIDFVKTQLGLNFILIDLSSSQSENGILKQAKYELVQELKQKNKLAFVMGIDEAQLDKKLTDIVNKQEAELKTQIFHLQNHIQILTEERDLLKSQLSRDINRTLRLSKNLMGQTLDSQLSITELDMQFSRQSSIAQSPIKCEESELSDHQSLTILESFMSELPALDGKVPQLKAIQDYLSQANSNSIPKQITKEQKQQEMITKNRDALLKKYLQAEDKTVDIEESRDDITPNYKPPNACTVILESFIQNNFNNSIMKKTQFPKLQFTNRDNLMTRINESSINPLSSARCQTNNVQDYFCTVQSNSEQQNESMVSEELSMLQEEIPVADIVSELMRVKHMYLKK